MRIEDYWTDIVLYYVEFRVYSERERKINKVLAFPPELSVMEVKNMIKLKFNNVLEIEVIDEIEDALYMNV